LAGAGTPLSRGVRSTKEKAILLNVTKVPSWGGGVAGQKKAPSPRKKLLARSKGDFEDHCRKGYFSSKGGTAREEKMSGRLKSGRNL